MQHPCRLLVPGSEPRRFDSVSALAGAVHELRAGRPIRTLPSTVTDPDFSGGAIVIRHDDINTLLAVAVIGEPELDPEQQDRLLAGALEAHRSGRRAA